jgi:hypothetical protein
MAMLGAYEVGGLSNSGAHRAKQGCFALPADELRVSAAAVPVVEAFGRRLSPATTT